MKIVFRFRLSTKIIQEKRKNECPKNYMSNQLAYLIFAFECSGIDFNKFSDP